MRLTMLGTGNALVTKCYNTCFTLEEDGRYLLVDGGGGNGVLSALERAGIDWRDVRDIYCTHKHLDHIMGVIWMVRMICQFMEAGTYEGEARIYAHDSVANSIRSMAADLLQPKQARHLDERLHIVSIDDGSRIDVIGHTLTAFDIGSTKMRQFGFELDLDASGSKLVCAGDEPLTQVNAPRAQGAKWLLHEAFCLASQADVFHPYEKHHSTVADAAALAEQLQVDNLVLYHTEDSDLTHRAQTYTAEAQRSYHGRVWVPSDLDVIDL